MAQSVYECMLIFDSNRYARDPGGMATMVPQMIEKCGGEVLASRLWNEQKLAYPIDGHKKGTYWLTYFRLDGTRLTEFARSCRLNESILRQLTLKVDPRLVDALVSRARGERPKPEEVVEVKAPVAVPAVEGVEGEEEAGEAEE